VGAGGFHTTTSTLIPAGATAWDAPITTVGATFDYVPTEIGEYAYQCTPHSAMMTGTFTVSLPTPGKMSDLSAKHTQPNTVLLSWTTFMEEGNRHFEIQKSEDGHKFSNIAVQPSLAAQGNSSSPINYTFQDNSATGDRAFYRLRQVNLDGQSAYSNVATVQLTKKANMSLQVHPNPAGESVLIHFNGEMGKNARLQVQTLNGKIIQEHSLNAAETNSINISLTGLAAGIYLIHYADDTLKLTQKLTKK